MYTSGRWKKHPQWRKTRMKGIKTIHFFIGILAIFVLHSCHLRRTWTDHVGNKIKVESGIDSSGILRTEINNRRGKLTMSVTKYKDGSLSISKIKNGRLHGPMIHVDTNGKTSVRGIYRRGKLRRQASVADF